MDEDSDQNEEQQQQQQQRNPFGFLTPSKLAKVQEEIPMLKGRIQELESRLAKKPATNLPSGIPAPKYDGRSDFFQFLKDFNIFATASSWSPADCVRMLPLFLEKEAKEVFLNIPMEKKRTWRDLTEEMAEQTKKFDPQMTA